MARSGFMDGLVRRIKAHIDFSVEGQTSEVTFSASNVQRGGW
jgi:hypothetical protein